MIDLFGVRVYAFEEVPSETLLIVPQVAVEVGDPALPEAVRDALRTHSGPWPVIVVDTMETAHKAAARMNEAAKSDDIVRWKVPFSLRLVSGLLNE